MKRFLESSVVTVDHFTPVNAKPLNRKFIRCLYGVFGANIEYILLFV